MLEGPVDESLRDLRREVGEDGLDQVVARSEVARNQCELNIGSGGDVAQADRVDSVFREQMPGGLDDRVADRVRPGRRALGSARAGSYAIRVGVCAAGFATGQMPA